jgi:hypothetical protein
MGENRADRHYSFLGRAAAPPHGDAIPPAVVGTVTMLESMFGRSFGQFGKGFHWFVFDAGTVNACKNGGLSVPFADEIYTYQTPFPGCVN